MIKSGKCFKIDRENNMYYIIDNNENIHILTQKQLIEEIEADNPRRFININEKTLDLNISKNSLERYSMLDSDEISEKTLNTYNKATVLGITPEFTKFNEINMCAYGSYDELCITDATRYLDGHLKANKITFVGGQSISRCTIIYEYIISCNKAIIRNKTVMSLILNKFIGGIKLDAKEIDIKHKYIDENTIFELYEIFEDYKKNERVVNRLHLIRVHFEYVKVDYEEILKNVKETIERLKYLEFNMKTKLTMALELANKSNTNMNYTDKLIESYMEFWSVKLSYIESLYVSLPAYSTYLKEQGYKILNTMKSLLNNYPLTIRFTSGRVLESYKHITQHTKDLYNESLDYFTSIERGSYG